MTVSLGPHPIWASSYRDVSDNLAKLLVNGLLYTYRDTARSELKTTYQDAAGTIPWTNPIQLDSSGSIPSTVYWDTDEPYYLVWTDSTSAQIIRTVEGYVPVSGAVPPPVTTNQDFLNYVYNSDFRFFYKQKYENGNILDTQLNKIAPRWLFERSNSTGSYTLEFKRFTTGQTDINEGNPRFYLNFACSIAGSGQTSLTAKYFMADVEQFQNLPASFGLWARKTGSAVDIEIALTQYFGSGGTPSSDVSTVILTQTLTDTWTKYTAVNFTLPSIAGKTLGTNDDSLLILEIRYPLSASCNIDIENIQLNEGTKLPPYEYETTELKFGEKAYLDFQNYSQDWYEDRYFTYMRTNEYAGETPLATGGTIFTLQSAIPVGAIIYWPTAILEIPAGWLLANGQAIIKWQFLRLYAKYGTRFGAAHLYTTRSAATVTAINYDNGNVTDATDVDTGMTITVTQQGTPSLPEKTDIIAVAGSILPNGSSFLIHSTTATFTVWFDRDFTGVRPTITGTEVKVNYSIIDTADEVAEAIVIATSPIVFKVIDLRGYFPRFMDEGAGRDPDAGTRTPTIGGHTDVGTTQGFEVQSHTHVLAINKQLNSADGAQTRIDPYGALATTPVNLTTNATGGNETRGINIGLFGIIKY
jgi:hypothetical protein